MGSTYRIKYWGEGTAPPAEVRTALDQLLDDFDRQMSTYRDDSELSQFNRAPAGVWFPVSADTAKAVQAALEYHRQTDGALDVTVGPLLRLWNFGPQAAKPNAIVHAPTKEQIETVLPQVGSQHLEVCLDKPALRKNLAGIEVELSSIAPGLAVDLVIEMLQRHDFANAMVEIGGEVRACGLRPDGTPWKIGVERPPNGEAGLARIVPLRDLAISTAGDYRIFRTADGKRYSHILDPRTGQALPYRGAAVTVLAKTCLVADALDTPLLVMGAQAGYAWCVEHEVSAMFQEPDGSGGVTVRTTPRLEALAGAP